MEEMPFNMKRKYEALQSVTENTRNMEDSWRRNNIQIISSAGEREQMQVKSISKHRLQLPALKKAGKGLLTSGRNDVKDTHLDISLRNF